MYIPADVKLGSHDVRSLSGGSLVSLHSGGSSKVYLTPRQHAQLKKGGAIRLRMNRHQFAHNVKHGGGIWDSFKNIVKKGFNAIKPHAINAIKKHGPTVGHMALDKLSGTKLGQSTVGKHGIHAAHGALSHFTGGTIGNIGASSTPGSFRGGSFRRRRKGGSFLLP